jgi:hypothetical protein
MSVPLDLISHASAVASYVLQWLVSCVEAAKPWVDLWVWVSPTDIWVLFNGIMMMMIATCTQTLTAA